MAKVLPLLKHLQVRPSRGLDDHVEMQQNGGLVFNGDPFVRSFIHNIRILAAAVFFSLISLSK